MAWNGTDACPKCGCEKLDVTYKEYGEFRTLSLICMECGFEGVSAEERRTGIFDLDEIITGWNLACCTEDKE